MIFLSIYIEPTVVVFDLCGEFLHLAMSVYNVSINYNIAGEIVI